MRGEERREEKSRGVSEIVFSKTSRLNYHTELHGYVDRRRIRVCLPII